MRRPVALAVLGALPFALTLLTMPFGRDQGIYAYTGARLLAGDVPYRDIFAFKPPSTAMVHALALALFGHSMTAIRALDVGWTLATVAVLAWLAGRLWDSRVAATVAGLAFAAIYCHFNYWTTGQTDGWATLPAALALALAVHGDRRGAVPSGLLLAGMLALKYTFVGAVALVLAVWAARDRGAALRAGIALAAGIAAAGLGLWAWGGLGAFLETQVAITLPYTGLDPRYTAPGGSGAAAIAKNVRSIGTPWLWAGAIGVAVGGWDAWHGRRGRALVWLGAAAAAVLSLVVQKKFFQYHFLPTLAPLAVAVGGVAALADRAAARWRSIPDFAALGLLAVLTTSPFAPRWTLLWSFVEGDSGIPAYWRSKSFVTPDTSLAENLAMAAWIREHTAADDRVFLWSYEPIVYFLADRRLVSRFLYHYPLVVPWAPPAYKDELMAAIAATPPKVVGVCDKDASPDVLGHPYTSWETFQAFPALRDWVAAHCDEAPRTKRWHVFTCDR